MERNEIIKNLISLVGLLPEERLTLVKELIAEWNLKRDDCFAEQVIVEQTVPEKHPAKRRERPSKAKLINSEKATGDAVSKLSTEQDREENKVVDKKGIIDTSQKLLKRRGRKPKSESSETIVPKKRGRPKKIVDGERVEIPVELNSSDEILIEAAKRIRDGRRLLQEDDDIVVNMTSATKKRNQAFVYYENYPVLQQQVSGKEQEFELLYKWNGKLLLSRYMLTDMMPMGIYIPYKGKVFGKYVGFIVYLYDEVVVQNVSEAIDDAKKRLGVIDNESWTVMDSLQWGMIKQFLDKLNRLLGKVGGDAMRGNYKTITPGGAYSSGIGRLRYTINVK